MGGDINLSDLPTGPEIHFRLVQGRNWRLPSHDSNAGPTIAVEISRFHSSATRGCEDLPHRNLPHCHSEESERPWVHSLSLACSQNSVSAQPGFALQNVQRDSQQSLSQPFAGGAAILISHQCSSQLSMKSAQQQQQLSSGISSAAAQNFRFLLGGALSTVSSLFPSNFRENQRPAQYY